MEELPGKKRYCYLTPNFPQTAFSIVIFIQKENDKKIVFPLYGLYTSIDGIGESIRELEAEFRKYGNHQNKIMDLGIVIPLVFNETYPLKRIHWANPSKHYAMEDRMRDFTKSLLSDDPYIMLVTPREYEEKSKTWQFNIAFPLSLTASDEELENFLLTSDYPVEERANSVAIYGMQKPKSVVWKELISLRSN